MEQIEVNAGSRCIARETDLVHNLLLRLVSLCFCFFGECFRVTNVEAHHAACTSIIGWQNATTTIVTIWWTHVEGDIPVSKLCDEQYLSSLGVDARTWTLEHATPPPYMIGGGAYTPIYVACIRHSTIYHASLLRWSTVPTPNRDTSSIWALTTFFPTG